MSSHASDKKISDLADSIRPLVRRIMDLKARMEALGLFANDRELLECTTCDLAESVAADGLLITIHRNGTDWNTNSGLRFEEVEKDLFRCPVCGTVQKAEEL
jgi:hypothetical protein